MELIAYASLSDCKAIDRATIETSSIGGDILMENAGQEMGRIIRSLFPKERDFFIFCGPGNNGGDGLVLARHLAKHKLNPLVGVWGKENDKSSNLFALNLKRLKDFKVTVHFGQEWKDFVLFKKTPIWIDALFGTGLSRILENKLCHFIEKINELAVQRVALDIPSGLPMYWQGSAVFKADVTLSVGLLKDIFLYPWFRPFLGEVKVVPLDFPPDIMRSKKSHLTLPSQVEADKGETSHKSTLGKSLIIAGSSQYPGAAILASKAALVNGSSFLYLGSPIKPLCYAPEIIPLEWGIENQSNHLLGSHFFLWEKIIDKTKHILIGPGLGKQKESSDFFKHFFNLERKNIIIDADALWHVRSHLATNDWKRFVKANDVLLTPHLGEFAHLWDKPVEAIKRDFLTYLNKTKEWGCQVLVKDAYLFYWNRASSSFSYYFPYPNRYLAKAGSGDVLAGFILGSLSTYYLFETAVVQGVLKYIQKAKHLRKKSGIDAPISLMTDSP